MYRVTCSSCSLRARVKRRGKLPSCPKCGKELRLGEEIPPKETQAPEAEARTTRRAEKPAKSPEAAAAVKPSKARVAPDASREAVEAPPARKAPKPRKRRDVRKATQVRKEPRVEKKPEARREPKPGKAPKAEKKAKAAEVLNAKKTSRARKTSKARKAPRTKKVPEAEKTVEVEAVPTPASDAEAARTAPSGIAQCPNCNATNRPGARSCEFCGRSLAVEAEEPAPEPAKPEPAAPVAPRSEVEEPRDRRERIPTPSSTAERADGAGDRVSREEPGPRRGRTRRRKGLEVAAIFVFLLGGLAALVFVALHLLSQVPPEREETPLAKQQPYGHYITKFEEAWRSSDRAAVAAFFSEGVRKLQRERLEESLAERGILAGLPDLSDYNEILVPRDDPRKVKAYWSIPNARIRTEWHRKHGAWVLASLGLHRPR